MAAILICFIDYFPNFSAIKNDKVQLSAIKNNQVQLSELFPPIKTSCVESFQLYKNAF
jgi:hypothetical protein